MWGRDCILRFCVLKGNFNEDGEFGLLHEFFIEANDFGCGP